MHRQYETQKGGRPEAEWDLFVLEDSYDKPIIETKVILEGHDIDKVLDFLRNAKSWKERENMRVKAHHNFGAREEFELQANHFLATAEMAFGR